MAGTRRILLGATIALLSSIVEGISPVEVKGTKLFTSEDGFQFFVKGVAYQRGGSTTVIDPLEDTNQCELDAGLMNAIGVNTVRVYTVDPTLNHDGCMQAFASQGIYGEEVPVLNMARKPRTDNFLILAWIDLPSPMASINRADPTYTEELFDRFSSVIDAFAKYNNTLSFTAANELINADNNVSSAPYIKAIVRDLKAFRDARGYRKIPISYSSADVSTLQLPTKNYLSCGDEDDSIEMYGMNLYSWCGNSSYTISGYDKVYTQFQDSNIPSLFTEVGCKESGPRTFGEVAAILGTVFPATFSGVIVYEWPQEANGYGLVEYPRSDGTGFPSTRADYDNLGSVYTTASPISTALTDYTPTNTPPNCPASNSDWPLAASETLPTIRALNMDTVTARTTYYSGTPTAVLAAGPATGTNTGSVPSNASLPEAQTALSTGAIAGIAVGGAAIGIAFAVGVFFFLRRQRDRTKRGEDGGVGRSSTTADAGENEGFNKAELPASAANPFVGKQELEPNHIHEADAGWRIHEMDPSGRKHVFEMPGSGPKASELEGTHPAQEVK